MIRMLYSKVDTKVICDQFKSEGVDIGPRRIYGLYYTDDIVLFVAHEDHLLNMFSIADRFAKHNGACHSVIINPRLWS